MAQDFARWIVFATFTSLVLIFILKYYDPKPEYSLPRIKKINSLEYIFLIIAYLTLTMPFLKAVGFIIPYKSMMPLNLIYNILSLFLDFNN